MLPADPNAPFVLLDNARVGGTAASRLYTAPIEVVVARRMRDVQPALDRLAEGVESGLYAAGYMSYEAGFALEKRLAPLDDGQAGDMPLLWFGLFAREIPIRPDEVAHLLPPPGDASVGPPEPLISREDYGRAFRKVKAYITAGDIYQANLTFPCRVPVSGQPAAIYASLRNRGGAGYGALVNTGGDWLLSLSPELFFTLRAGEMRARPMKGTAPRHADPVADAAEIHMLRTDPKQRAENLMIVDLLRNDLSRVSRAGSVSVPDLFQVETYPTVHQMTSTVRSQLLPALGPIDALRALYPCGSVTGAPKIRAMEVIHDVEVGPRGPYTGSIGRIGPDGEAAFNVAIRTLTLRSGESHAMLGLGSGIVADSEEEPEWVECLAKARFLGH